MKKSDIIEFINSNYSHLEVVINKWEEHGFQGTRIEYYHNKKKVVQVGSWVKTVTSTGCHMWASSHYFRVRRGVKTAGSWWNTSYQLCTVDIMRSRINTRILDIEGGAR